MFSHTRCCGESRVLRQMFGLEREKAKGSCRKVYLEELHKLYFSLNINRVIELRTMCWAEQMTSLVGGRKFVCLNTTWPLKWPTCWWKYVGQGLLIIEDSRSHSDTPHSIELLWTSDQPDAETSVWQHRTLTRDRRPCHRWDLNPQYQLVSGRRPTP